MRTNTAWTMGPWLEQSRPFFLSLLGADVSSVGAVEAIGGTLKSLREWMATNPCPDTTLSARVELLAGRYGYIGLVDGADRLPPNDTGSDRDDRVQTLADDLVALVADVEKLRTGFNATSDEG